MKATLQNRSRYQSLALAAFVCSAATVQSQLVDKTLSPNAANEGIAKSLAQQIGAGSGDIFAVDSSACMIARDAAANYSNANLRSNRAWDRAFRTAKGM